MFDNNRPETAEYLITHCKACNAMDIGFTITINLIVVTICDIYN